MLNQVSKRILLASFPKKLNNHQLIQKPYLYKSIKFFFFNAGKYDINKDYYGILGLSKSATPSQIKKEYYKLAKLYHPDVNPSASQKFKLINEAYGVLSDQKLKAEYDDSRGEEQAKQKFYQKRGEYQKQQDYRAQYYQQYRRAYEEMDDYDRYMIKKQFTRIFFRLFFFGFIFTLFSMALFGGPRRVLVDEFGRPVDIHGRPIDRYGNPIPYPAPVGPPIYDPYGLGGTPRNAYPPQNQYGMQYTSQSPARQPQPTQNPQNYY